MFFYSLHLPNSALGLAPLLEGSSQSQTIPGLHCGVDLGHSKSLAHWETSPPPSARLRSASPVFWFSWAPFRFSQPPERATSTTKDAVYHAVLLPTGLCHAAFYTVINASDNQLTERKGLFSPPFPELQFLSLWSVSL